MPSCKDGKALYLLNVLFVSPCSLCNIGSMYFKVQSTNINIVSVYGVFCGLRATKTLIYSMLCTVQLKEAL